MKYTHQAVLLYHFRDSDNNDFFEMIHKDKAEDM